jgi:hypothetical protein
MRGGEGHELCFTTALYPPLFITATHHRSRVGSFNLLVKAVVIPIL